jgi:hypothetical protein
LKKILYKCNLSKTKLYNYISMFTNNSEKELINNFKRKNIINNIINDLEIVKIIINSNNLKSSVTGTVLNIDNDNYVLTCYHCLKNMEDTNCEVFIRYRNREYMTYPMFVSLELDLIIFNFPIDFNNNLKINNFRFKNVLKNNEEVKVIIKNEEEYDIIKCNYESLSSDSLFVLPSSHLSIKIPYLNLNTKLKNGESGSPVIHNNAIVGVVNSIKTLNNKEVTCLTPSIVILRFIQEFILKNKDKRFSNLCSLVFDYIDDNGKLNISNTYDINYNEYVSNKKKPHALLHNEDIILKIDKKDIVYKEDSIIVNYKKEKLSIDVNQEIDFYVFYEEFNSFIGLTTYMLLTKIDIYNDLKKNNNYLDIRNYSNIQIEILRKKNKKLSNDYKEKSQIVKLNSRCINTIFNLNYVSLSFNSFKYKNLKFIELDFNRFISYLNINSSNIEKNKNLEILKDLEFISNNIKKYIVQVTNDIKDDNIKNKLLIVEKINNNDIIHIEHLEKQCVKRKNIIKINGEDNIL